MSLTNSWSRSGLSTFVARCAVSKTPERAASGVRHTQVDHAGAEAAGGHREQWSGVGVAEDKNGIRRLRRKVVEGGGE